MRLRSLLSDFIKILLGPYEGYSEIYNRLLTEDGFVEESKVIPAEQQGEVLEDFEMYHFLINHGKKSDISFVGYDANHSTKYGFANVCFR